MGSIPYHLILQCLLAPDADFHTISFWYSIRPCYVCMDCSITLCQNAKYIGRNITTTLLSMKQLQEDETSLLPLTPGLVLLFFKRGMWRKALLYRVMVGTKCQ
jgi:hypothetical protein